MFRNRLSISSWSLHRCLGPLRWTVWDESSRTQTVSVQEQPELFTLVQLPSIAAARGLSYLELCHFHFPSREEGYLALLQQSFADAGIVFHTLLVDYGDLSSPDAARRESDLAYLTGWIDTAAQAGASAVRIVAGEQPASDAGAIQRSADGLSELSRYGSAQGVRVVTENFRELTSTVASWRTLLERSFGEVSTIVDFGNLAKHEKQDGVKFGAPLAHSFHAKPEYAENGTIREESLRELLQLAGEGNGTAPVSVIFDRDGDMWEGIERIKAIILQLEQ
ncbi:MAG: Xylose isomerase domain protein barrel [Paenibacillus sp.]|nr:Xylose isomerase domain protein barrel [Paenibacillus sp.]